MAYRKGLHIRLSLVAMSAIAAWAFVLQSDAAHAAQKYKYTKRHFTSQESRRRPAQYRRDELKTVDLRWATCSAHTTATKTASRTT